MYEKGKDNDRGIGNGAVSNRGALSLEIMGKLLSRLVRLFFPIDASFTQGLH